MAHKTQTYAQVRSKMQPGDIVAFGGKGAFSDIIKFATASAVSHVGVIFESKVLIGGDAQAGHIVDVMESTTLSYKGGKTISGVQRNRMSDHIEYYDGQIWWLPLSPKLRATLNLAKFIDFLLNQDNKPYDMPQAVLSAIDLTDRATPQGWLTHNKEDFGKFFCSELAVAALEAGGGIKKINASEVTPVDLCNFSIYASDYVQLKGAKKVIKGFNSNNPEGWGE
jgi:hypothetical protein